MMNPEKVSLKLSRFVKITRLNKLLILAMLAFIIGIYYWLFNLFVNALSFIGFQAKSLRLYH